MPRPDEPLTGEMVGIMNALRKPVVREAKDTDKSDLQQAGPITRQAIVAQEIAAAVWPTFCRSFTANFHGVCTSVERVEDPDQRKVECIDRPLEELVAATQENGVMAIRVTVAENTARRTFAVPGPYWVRLHYNAAGMPTLLEIGYSEGTLSLRFTGPAPVGLSFSANSWGE
jgi:hypothetical protein